MPTAKHRTCAGAFALAMCVALVGCSKLKQNDPPDASRQRVQTKRQQDACGSASAYNSLKEILFDKAVSQRTGDRSKLDMLAAYSFIRMEDPVVTGWDPALDKTRRRGRMILEVPAGARQAFGGQQHLGADVEYTAQAAADGNGFVDQLDGAASIVTDLAAFNLNSGAYRPSPVIDDRQSGPDVRTASIAPLDNAPASALPPAPTDRHPTANDSDIQQPASSRTDREPQLVQGGQGASTIRAFHGALGSGNGALASAQIISEKRRSRAFSRDAISSYYGRLAEPLRLTGIQPTAGGAHLVTYRYSSGRSWCEASAVVNLTNRNGRIVIRPIRALTGC